LKRETLERNLKRVVSRIEEGIPPVHIVAVLGFGSFFRLKEKPGDIDLIILYQKDPEFDEKVNRFTQHIAVLRSGEEGRNILERYVSNDPVAIFSLKEQFPGLPVDVWAKHLKATGFYEHLFSHHFNAEDITKKLLREGHRGIQISELRPIENFETYLSSMPTKIFKIVWSLNERDVDKNLQETSEREFNLILAEIKNFAIQVERYKAYYYVLSNVSKWVIDAIQVHRRLPDEEQVVNQVQIVGSKRGVLDPYLKWIINPFSNSSSVKEPKRTENVTRLDIDSEIAQIKDSVKDVFELGVLCESMRGEIKEYESKCAFAKGLLSSLIFNDPYNPRPIGERVVRSVRWTLHGTPMYKAKDEVKRKVLIDLGLHEINRKTVLVVDLYGKSEYRLAESEEDLQELTERSKKGKMERKYAKYIKAIIRKAFPKNTEVDVDFNSVIGEDGVAVPQKLFLEAATSEEDHENFLNVVENSEFVINESGRAALRAQWDTNYIEAILELDISQLNGDRKLIKKLIESKLLVRP